MSAGFFNDKRARFNSTNLFENFELTDELSDQITKRIGEGSWCDIFYKNVTAQIEEKDFAVLYSDNPASRPSSPIALVVAALVLKALNNLTDDQLIDRCITDLQFRTALGLNIYDHIPFSKNTFNRFRTALDNYKKKTGKELLRLESKAMANRFCAELHIDKKKIRMDSMMIKSHGRFMTRLEIIVSTNRMCVQTIAHNEQNHLIPENLSHYLNADDINRIVYHQEENVIGSKLENAIQESFEIEKIMKDSVWMTNLHEYSLLVRMIDDQTKQDENGNRVLKDKKEISPSSLQNPFDEDATYRAKAGKGYRGYTGNFASAYDGEGANIIIDADYEQNTVSDPSMLEDYIDEVKDTGDKPEEITADGAYKTDATDLAAKEAGIDFHATSLTGPKPNPAAENFVFNEDGTVLEQCANGAEPISQSVYKNGQTIRAVMDKSKCNKDCPFFEYCHPKEQKKGNVITTSAKEKERSLYIKSLGEEESKRRANERNGVEGLPSEFRRKYGVDRIPVSGIVRSRIFFTGMVMARNFKALLNNTSEKYRRKRQLAKERKMRAAERWDECAQIAAA